MRQSIRSKSESFDPRRHLLTTHAAIVDDVVKERNMRDKFKIVTFDAEQLAIQQMSDGMIDAMVVQNPFGMGLRIRTLLLCKADQ